MKAGKEQAKATPGPWTYREAYDNGEPCGYVVQSGVNAIADVPQGEADAALIAAAPELLEALQAVLNHVEDDDIKRVHNQCTLCHTYRSHIRDVIAKATGETKP